MKKKIQGNDSRPRLYVFKSNKHIYAQLINDIKKTIVVSSSSVSPNIKKSNTLYATCDTAKLVGKDIAKKSSQKGIDKIIFDRGQKQYHGQIKALADAAREEGMIF